MKHLFRYGVMLAALVMPYLVFSRDSMSPESMERQARASLEGTDPDASIGHRIKYLYAGPIPPLPLFMVVQISTRRFETFGRYEWLIVLPASGYSRLDKFTSNVIAHADCSAQLKATDSTGIAIYDYSDGKVRSCLLAQHAACDYFSGVMNLKGIDWGGLAERNPIDSLPGEIGCKHQ